MTKLKDLASLVNFLSGGQQQSVAVGRAVYWSVKTLIFDEPTNNLGVWEQAKAINLIRTIRDTQPEVLIITISHNLQHMFSIVDRIMVLRHGEKLG